MSKPKLLIIEDEAQIASLLACIAEEEGYETLCTTGIRHIERDYLHFQPDVIMLDILMPDMDGLEVLQCLKTHHCTSRIAILSGSEALSRRIAETLGKHIGLTIVANLSKPFRVTPIRELLRRLKNGHSGMNEPMPIYNVS